MRAGAELCGGARMTAAGVATATRGPAPAAHGGDSPREAWRGGRSGARLGGPGDPECEPAGGPARAWMVVPARGTG